MGTDFPPEHAKNKKMEDVFQRKALQFMADTHPGVRFAGRTVPAQAFPLLLLFGACATILGAYGFEYIGGYEPCPLCLEQRGPYYLAIPVAALGLVLRLMDRAPRISGPLFAAVGAIFLYSAYLGGFHAGVEWRWWPGPADCAVAAAGGGAGDITSLMAQLETARIVPCDEVQWRFLGLSFAGYNFLISLALAALALLAFRSRTA